MRYFICSEKGGKLNILSVYDSRDEAFKRLKYFVKREKCVLKIIPLPKISVGCKIYRSDGTYYGTIVYETNVLWGVSGDSKAGIMPNPYAKQRMDQLIIDKGLTVADGKEFAEVGSMMSLVSELNSKVSDLLKSFEYLKAEQIGFFK